MPGLRLALGLLTVLPVRPPTEVDRRTAASAIRWAPLPGLLLGLLAAGLLYGLARIGAPPLVAALLVLAAGMLATRGMHVDGLADTADGLGCYGPPERALAVMRDGGAGPFAVATLLMTLGLQAASLARLATLPDRWTALPVAALAARCAFAWCCRRGVPAARPEGLGALVADSQPWFFGVLGAAVTAAVAITAVPARPWQGPVGVVVAAAFVAALSAHTTRRFGGVTGDVLGAAAELATTAVLVVAATG